MPCSHAPNAADSASSSRNVIVRAHARERGPRSGYCAKLSSNTSRTDAYCVDVDFRRNARGVVLEPDLVHDAPPCRAPPWRRAIRQPSLDATTRDLVSGAVASPAPAVRSPAMLHQISARLATRCSRVSAVVRRETARSRCRKSRRHRPGRRRRRCRRRARACASATNGSIRRPASPAGTCPAAGFCALAARPSVEALARSCGRDCPRRPAPSACCGGASRSPSILPTARQMSSPTVSASSIGPIGMPNASAASSTVSGAMPSSTQRIAAIRYGASTRLTRKPGALFTGSGSLSMLAHECRGARHERRLRRSPDDDFDQHHPRHRIEEMQADAAATDRASARRCPRAECATCWSRGARRRARVSRARRTARAWPRGSRRSPR